MGLTKVTYAMIEGAPVNVLDYGADPTGTDDSAAAIQAAIDTGKGTIAIPDGTYKVDSSIVLRSNLNIVMEKTTELDFSSAGDVEYFSGAGTAAASIPTTSNVTAQTFTIDVGSTSSLAVGDMLRLSSDAVFDPNRTSTQIAELVYVESLTSTQITTTTPIQDNYTTADNAKIEKITPVKNIYIYGGKISGNSSTASVDYGVRVNFGENIIVEDTYFYNIDAAMIQFNNCVASWARNCKFYYGRANLAYGVSFANATRDSGCVNSTFNDVRHSLSTNSSSGSAGGIVRRILFANNIVYDSAKNLSGGGSDAIDTHAAAEYISILNNKVFGSSLQGINVECSKAEIIGNEIVDTVSNGITCSNQTLRKGEYVISNNKIIGAGSSAIRVATSASNEEIFNLTINGNNVRNATNYGIYIPGGATLPNISNIAITGNSIVDATGTLSSIFVDYVYTASITGNAVYCVDTSGVRLGHGSNIVFSSNVITLPTSATGIGFYLSGTIANDISNVIVANNTVRSPSPVSSRGLFAASGVSGLVARGNNFQECTTPYSFPAVVIASGVATIVGDVGSLSVDTEGSAATDDLDTISGGIDRQVLVVRAVSSARDIVMKDGTGNMKLAGDFTLTNVEDTITLIYIGTTWYEMCRSDNGA